MEQKFSDLVYRVVALVPRGKVVGYGQIGLMIGHPRASRQVGWAMRNCPDALPWHRVVKADGSIAGGGHAEMRRALLEAEGIPFLPDGRVDMKQCRWQPENVAL